MGGSAKKTTVGYKYYLGAHMGIVHGPIDKFTRIRVADKVAWEGESTGGQIDIQAPNLFGGESSEGGISGLVDFEMGEPTQDVNDYLQAQQPVSGETIPAYRGVASAVLRQVYLGVNPYLKAWEFRGQRIHTSTRGAVQWYDEKSEVPGESGDIVSEWDFSSITLSGESSSDVMLSSESVWVSNDERYAFTVRRSGFGGVLDSWEMSTPGDLSSLLHTGSYGGSSLFTPHGVFARDDGMTVYAFDRTTDRLRTISLSTPFDAGSASETSSISFPAAHFALHFRGDGEYLYNCTGTTIKQWRLTSSWNPSGGVTLAGSFDLSGVTGTFLQGVSGRPDGSEIFATNNVSSGGWSIVAADPDNISTGTLSDNIKPGVNIKGDFHILPNGESMYASDDPANTVEKYDFSTVVQSGDMNPAHIIRECLTDTNWGLGYTSDDIDDSAFTAAADTLFDEEFGLSLLWSQNDSIEEFIKDVLQHIDAALYVDPRTGKFVLKLIRDDYVAASLPVFDESNIDTIDDYKKPTIGELKNYVTIKYWDRATSQDSTVSVQDIALAQQQGSVSSAKIPMNGITNATLASRVASRELAALSNPIITCTIITNRDGASLNIGDAFKLSWPKYGLTETIMRVANISFGTLDNGQVKIECAQDVFGLPNATFSDPTDSSWAVPTTAPDNSPYKIAQESNYWLLIQEQGESFVIDELDGYLLTAAVRPSADSVNYRIWTDESGSYEEKEPADFCPTATISGSLQKAVDGVIQTSVNITSGVDLDEIDIGGICQIDDEYMEVISYTATTSTAGVLVVGRGVVDTAIADHPSGSRVFFWGDNFYGSSTTLYQYGDSINVKITPETAQGQLDVTLADALPLEFNQRAFRAYPPGNIKIDSVYFPPYIENATEFTATWADRDRTLQTGPLEDFTTGNIGPEVGVTYSTEVTRVDTGATLDSSTGLATTTDTLVTDFDGVVLFDIKSVRDSLDSFYSQSHQLVISRTGVLTTEQNEIIYDESGDPIFTES